MRKRIEELYNLINKYNDEYYNKNNSLISDFEYDKLFNELVELEKQFPQFVNSDSPTKKVGGQVDLRFQKVSHDIPMLSLDNAFSVEDLIRFDQTISKSCRGYSYVCELKIDGLAMSFKYQNGKLIQAVTRGDGEVGEDVTHNIITINSLPKSIMSIDDVEVRGEVFVGRNEFLRLNDIQESKGQKRFANPRNLAAGSVRQLDSKVCSERNLDAFIYSRVGRESLTHFEDLEKLKLYGMNVNNHVELKSSIEEVIEYVNYWDKHRHNLEYETDGIVIKVNEYENQDLLGYTSRAPKWAIAYKYKAMQVETKINSIAFQVGRTGKVTPVANLESVSVSGSVVSRATLHNENYVLEKDIRVNDFVLIHKAGEIIPEVVEVLKNKRGDVFEFKMIENCPVCGSVLVKEDANHFCKNEFCNAKMVRRLSYFASIDAMNIDGLGEKIVEILFEKGFVNDLVGVYELYKRKEELVELEGFGNKRVDLLLSSIESSKECKLEQFITGLGIKNVGKKIASVLVNNFGDLESISKASVEDLENIDEIGKVIARSVVDYFKSEEYDILYEYVRSNGFNFKVDNIMSNSIYSNKIICVTGSFEKYKRKDIESVFKSLGSKVSSSVSKNTDYLVVGKKAGSKLDKAKEYGTTIIEEEELAQIMEENNG